MAVPLVITQGPTEPKLLRPYLQGTLKAFHELGPSGKQPTPHIVQGVFVPGSE
jgi:hypothetical protein